MNSLPSYGLLVAILSLNTVAQLAADGVVFSTLTITNVSTATPMVVTVAEPPPTPIGSRVFHGVVSGVSGTTEANGTWALTPVTGTTTQFTLSTFDAQGNVVQPGSAHAYAGGGIVQIPLPDGTFLLGRRHHNAGAYVACPRFVFVPTKGKPWYLDGYGGEGQPGSLPPTRGGSETQFQKLQRNIGTRYATFEVYVSGVASPPDPDGGDFDAVLYLTGVLYGVLFDTVTPYGGHILAEYWPSQLPNAAALEQYGQQWMGVIEFPLPLMDHALQFVPVGTVLQETVQPVNPLVPDDQTVIDIPT